MNSFLSIFLSLFIISVVAIQLTSSASFPNPPQFPPPHASADEWSQFLKLLHNYYAIIARPRFGKRYDSISNHPSLLEILNPNSASSSSENFNDDQRINYNDYYTYTQADRRR